MAQKCRFPQGSRGVFLLLRDAGLRCDDGRCGLSVLLPVYLLPPSVSAHHPLSPRALSLTVSLSLSLSLPKEAARHTCGVLCDVNTTQCRRAMAAGWCVGGAQHAQVVQEPVETRAGEEAEETTASGKGAGAGLAQATEESEDV